MLKRTTAEILAKYILRTGRGMGLLNQVTDVARDILQGTVYLFALKGLMGIEITPVVLIVVVIFKKVSEYILGWADERLGFWKVQNDYAARQLTPFNQEMLKRVKNIEDRICKINTVGESLKV